MSLAIDDLISRLKELAPTHDKRALAAALNMTYAWVRYYCKVHGIKTARSKHERSLQETIRIAEFAISEGNLAAATKYAISHNAVKSIVARYRSRLKENSNPANTARMQRVRFKCLKHASKTSFYQEADDFASYAVMRCLAGSKSKIDFMWIDFLRERFGDPRSPSGLDRMSETLYPAEALNDKPEWEEGETPNRDISGVVVSIHENRLIELIDSCAIEDKKLRAIAILTFVYGMKNSELSISFGVSPGRITQFLTEIISQIKDRIK